MMAELDINGNPVHSSADKFMGWNTIYRIDDSSRYMTRLWIGRLRLHIFHRGDTDPDMHDHPWGFWTFPLTAYLEEAASFPIDDACCELCTDSDVGCRVCHLSGELNAPTKIINQIVQAFKWSYRPATHTHRVLGRWPHEFIGMNRPFHKIVTIVWTEKKSRSWGFLKNRDDKWCWLPWRDYVFKEGTRDAPCS
jgi:hypothetical protein